MLQRPNTTGKRRVARHAPSGGAPPNGAGLNRWHFRRWIAWLRANVSRETLRTARAIHDVSRETFALARAMLALLALLIVVPDSPRNRARVDAAIRRAGLDRPDGRPD